MIGTSGADNSTMILSIPKQANADIKCSIVPTLTPLFGSINIEDNLLPSINNGSHLIFGKSGKSVRTNSIPESHLAGFNFNCTLQPECKPTPIAVISFSIVL